MRHSRARINRRIIIDPAPLEGPDSGGLVAAFHDAWGAAVQRFDLADLGLPPDVAVMFAAAFRGHYPGKAAETRKGCWRALMVFARFVAQDDGIGALGDLTNGAVGRYLVWLDRQSSRAGKPWSLALRHNRYHHIKILLEWVGKHHPDCLPERPAFPYNPFPGRHAGPADDPRRLAAMQLKAILQGCYEEIDAAWALFEEGRRILTKAPAIEYQLTRKGLLRLDHRAGSGTIMSRGALQRCFGVGRASGRRGDPDDLVRYLHLTSDTLAPLFVAIAIQTAANPDALRLIDRDCVEPHPLIEHRAVVDWAKGRAGRMLKRAQRRSFDRRRPYAAPNLIDKVFAMTAPLAALAPPGERDRLFLLWRPHRRIGVVQHQTLSNAIARFVTRQNARVTAWNAAHPDRPRPILPPFTPKLFRGSVAAEHYRASGGDIRAAQAVLNHSRADITDGYIRGPQTRRLQQETIARLQAMMVAWITGGSSSSGPASPPPGLRRQPAEAFGHRCADPFAGSAGKRLCPQFGGCLACPGLVVPIDAEHLARVLLVVRQLDAARRQVDPERWALIYGPSYRILTEDILPDFPADLRVAAEQLMPMLPILPSLE